jgi:hypothetical protein
MRVMMNPTLEDAPPSVKLWWAAPVGGLLVLLLVILVLGRSEDTPRPGTSYDASAHGFRAAYLLLEELHYPVFRSRRLNGQGPRWVLFPIERGEVQGARDVRRLDTWVRSGGHLLLADRSAAFARGLGMDLKIKTDADDGAEPATGAGVARLVGGKVRVDWPGHPGRVWAEAGGKPVVSVHEFGAGQIWLVHRPELLTNQLVGKADNAVLVCRLAEAMLQERPGQLAFDEYFHGLHERPGVIELLLQPPALWVTLQALLLTLLLLWHYVPRFGVIRSLPGASRRSQEEFLDAMAALLARKADYTDAFHTARAELVRTMERELGLPTGAPTALLVRETVKRRPIAEERLRRLLAADRSSSIGNRQSAIGSARAFLTAMNELETVRHEFFHGQHHR